MPTLNFGALHNYAASPTGIEIPLLISAARDRSIRVLAKVDTDAENCIFRREHAEELELSANDGERKTFATATGTLLEPRGIW